jgi:hypothetical protein
MSTKRRCANSPKRGKNNVLNSLKHCLFAESRLFRSAGPESYFEHGQVASGQRTALQLSFPDSKIRMKRLAPASHYPSYARSASTCGCPGRDHVSCGPVRMKFALRLYGFERKVHVFPAAHTHCTFISTGS